MNFVYLFWWFVFFVVLEKVNIKSSTFGEINPTIAIRTTIWTQTFNVFGFQPSVYFWGVCSGNICNITSILLQEKLISGIYQYVSANSFWNIIGGDEIFTTWNQILFPHQAPQKFGRKTCKTFLSAHILIFKSTKWGAFSCILCAFWDVKPPIACWSVLVWEHLNLNTMKKTMAPLFHGVFRSSISNKKPGKISLNKT